MRIKNLRNIEDVLNYGLKILGKWSDDLLLKYNSNKTKSVFFLPNQNEMIVNKILFLLINF